MLAFNRLIIIVASLVYLNRITVKTTEITKNKNNDVMVTVLNLVYIINNNFFLNNK